MSRIARKNLLNGYCHITHRCQERRFFFKFSKDRDNYVKRLRDTANRYGINILNYVITSNHIHLLVYFKSVTDLSEAMHYLEGSAAKDFNLRRGREGVFWSGRYHATLIEKGEHLTRCMFYIDMNMIRAGVVKHPSEWKHSGYHELCGKRKRYRVIRDSDIINTFICFDNIIDFRNWYNAVLDEEILKGFHKREKYWSEAIAVGSLGWLETLSIKSGNKQFNISCSNKYSVKEENSVYILTGSTRNNREFWKKYS